MLNVSVLIPWFFALYEEIASLKVYQLVNLYAEINNSRSLVDKRESARDYRIYYFPYSINLNTIPLTSKFFWLQKTILVQNPKPEPTSWWGKRGYTKEWTENFIVGNIEIKDDDSVEIWIYGERFIEELKEFFGNLKSLENREIILELRQRPAWVANP